jgi:thiosulfate/3-mercaptopyruvate sulfurtransferase
VRNRRRHLGCCTKILKLNKVIRRIKVRKKLTIGMGSIALVLVLVAVLVIGAAASAYSPSREIDAIVSTQWLEENLSDPDLVILDVRTPFEYPGGHIPDAVNSYEGEWYINDPVPPFNCFNPYGEEFPCMELPPDEDIFANIEAAGITGDSKVVVVSRTVALVDFGPAEYAVAGATRVAVTLIYAGIENVAILDGGYDKWVAEGRETTTEVPEITPSSYDGDVNEEMFVSMDYVQDRIGRILRTKIVDSRDADVYFGVTNEPWAQYSGHIPNAKSLPVPWLWNVGVNYTTYKDTTLLEDMGAGVVGRQICGWWGCLPREIIVYCGVGGYASTNYFVLSEVLGYENVKIYDGSAQEWTWAGKPVNLYEWE